MLCLVGYVEAYPKNRNEKKKKRKENRANGNNIVTTVGWAALGWVIVQGFFFGTYHIPWLVGSMSSSQSGERYQDMFMISCPLLTCTVGRLRRTEPT